MQPSDWEYVICFRFFKPDQTVNLDLGPGSYDDLVRSLAYITMLTEEQRVTVAEHFKVHHLRKFKLRKDSLNCRIRGVSVNVESFPVMLKSEDRADWKVPA